MFTKHGVNGRRWLRTAVFVLSVMLLVVLISPLQAGFEEFVDSGQSLGSYVSNEIALGDLDGDGDLDTYESNTGTGGGGGYPGSPDRIWFNDGSGFFTDSGQAIGNVKSGAVDTDLLNVRGAWGGTASAPSAEPQHSTKAPSQRKTRRSSSLPNSFSIKI